jgi:hypothetical protein
MIEVEKRAHELADALREHTEEPRIRSLHDRLERSDRLMNDEVERVKRCPAEA